ncbi:unnamed protein product [Cercopithifilaria johnstoni]|uniref:Uncharacterized protein n=1 Tax=Cercopithifilaria johnstoni TaxID=2874296 RepID=A0A8J2Q8R5_9BILA|nr:unnamed protein product [Cercopithifilaria johnstoni]
MSMMIVVNNISKSTSCTFFLLIITITIASTFDLDELMYDDDELTDIWKRSNAELINGLIGMDLKKLAKAGKRSISTVVANDKSVRNRQRFNNVNLKKFLSNRRFR